MAKYGPKPKSDAEIEQSLRLRFFSRFIKTERGCWIWQGSINKDGYGRLKFRLAAVQAHVTSWFLHAGKWPEKGQEVCHSCDVPACVNPGHLFLGTHADNMRDSIRKGRFNPANGLGRKLAPKMTCKQGHQLSGENLRIVQGKRRCWTCKKKYHREWMRAYAQRKRAGLQLVYRPFGGAR